MGYTPYHATWSDQPSTLTPITAAALMHIEAGISASQQVLVPSGDTSGVTDATAVAAAVTALSGSPGLIKLSPVGPWYIEGGQVVVNASGIYIDARGCVIHATGSGAVFDMHDSSDIDTRAVQGGGLFGLPTIDGTSCTSTSQGFLFSDIFQGTAEVITQNFTAGTLSKGSYFNNRYYWTEQLHARVIDINSTQGILFYSTGVTAVAGARPNATGSFERGKLDLNVLQFGAGNDGIIWQNGAFIEGGEVSMHGNFGTAAITQPAVPASTVTATNTTGYSVYVVLTGGTYTVVNVNGVSAGTGGTYIVPAGQTIAITYSAAPTWTWTLASAAIRVNGTTPSGCLDPSNSIIVNGSLNIDFECDGTGAYTPFSIYYGTTSNNIYGNTGTVNFGANVAFQTSNSNGQFGGHIGVVTGDAALAADLPAGSSNMVSGAQTVSATTATALASLAGSLQAFTAYDIRLYLPHLGAGTTGTFTFALGGLTIAAASLDIKLWTGATLTTHTLDLTTGTLLAVAPSASQRTLEVTGTIAVTTAGTLTVTGAKTTGGSNVTVDAGASILLTPLASP